MLSKWDCINYSLNNQNNILFIDVSTSRRKSSSGLTSGSGRQYVRICPIRGSIGSLVFMFLCFSFCVNLMKLFTKVRLYFYVIWLASTTMRPAFCGLLQLLQALSQCTMWVHSSTAVPRRNIWLSLCFDLRKMVRSCWLSIHRWLLCLLSQPTDR